MNLFFITLHTGQGRVRKKMQALYACRLHLLWRVTAIRHRWCQDGHRCVKQTNNTSEQTSKQASKQTNKEQTNIQELPLVRVPSRAAIQNGKRVSTKVRGAAAWRSGRQHRLATMRIQDGPRCPTTSQDAAGSPQDAQGFSCIRKLIFANKIAERSSRNCNSYGPDPAWPGARLQLVACFLLFLLFLFFVFCASHLNHLPKYSRPTDIIATTF